MKHIILTQGFKTIVDDADFDWLVALGWWHYAPGKPGKTGYAVRRHNGPYLSMHNVIYAYHYSASELVDHKNRNSLDNQLHNLRAATPSQNQANKDVQTNSITGIAGVAWHKQAQKWRAYITVNGKQKSLGLFSKIEDAAAARVVAAKKYFGEFAP